MCLSPAARGNHIIRMCVYIPTNRLSSGSARAGNGMRPLALLLFMYVLSVCQFMLMCVVSSNVNMYIYCV